MNIYFLKYFYDTIRLGSMTASASENHVTKSAISQGVSQLEITLGIPLLTHRRNTIKVTEEGLAVFESSRALFLQLENLKTKVKSSKSEYEGCLAFACSHSLALSIFPKLYEMFCKEAPKVRLKLIPGHTGSIKKMLQQGDIEFGLVLDNDDLSPFSLDPIYTGKFQLFESCERKKSPIKSCIFPPARVEVFAFKQAFFDQFGFELKTDCEVCSWEIIAELISLNQCVGMIPDYMMWNKEKAKMIRPTSLKLQIPYTLYVAHHYREKLSKNAELFVSLLKTIAGK